MPTRTSSTCICTGLRFTKDSVYGIGCPHGALILLLLRWKPRTSYTSLTSLWHDILSNIINKFAAASAESWDVTWPQAKCRSFDERRKKASLRWDVLVLSECLIYQWILFWHEIYVISVVRIKLWTELLLLGTCWYSQLHICLNCTWNDI